MTVEYIELHNKLTALFDVKVYSLSSIAYMIYIQVRMKFFKNEVICQSKCIQEAHPLISISGICHFRFY